MGTEPERHLAKLQTELRATDKRHQDAMITKETTEFIVKRVTKVCDYFGSCPALVGILYLDKSQTLACCNDMGCLSSSSSSSPDSWSNVFQAGKR